ncbi:MAG: hypothetical protein J7K95_05150 [Thermoplasmata archaeon]|nr:hypothetical protein [Thermoplasmata archaeon]
MKAFLYAAIKNGETAKRILSSGKKLSEEERKYLLEVIRQAEKARRMLEKS